MRKAFLKKCKPPPQVFSLIVSICSGPWPLVTLWGFTLPWEKKSPSFLAHHIRPWTPCLLSASAFLQAPATHPAGIIVPKYRLFPPWVCTSDFSLLVWHVSLLGLANSLSFKCHSRGRSTLKPLHALLVKENHTFPSVCFHRIFIPLFIHSFKEYLLKTYHVPVPSHHKDIAGPK